MENKITWKLDPAHSEILFKVRHLMITNVKGEFRKFDATVVTDADDFTEASVEARIDAASVFTNNDDRDKHLRSEDFLEAEKHPEIIFRSTSFVKQGDDFRLTGELTIRGVSKTVTFDVEYGGLMKDPYGNHKAGFSVSGKLNRKDWGLNWNAALEAGGVMVSDEVKVSAEVQFVKQNS